MRNNGRLECCPHPIDQFGQHPHVQIKAGADSSDEPQAAAGEQNFFVATISFCVCLPGARWQTGLLLLISLLALCTWLHHLG